VLELPIYDIGCHIDKNWNTVVRVIQANDDIPIPNNLNVLYMDFETTSENPNKTSVNPHSESMDDESHNLHKDCKICGVAFLFDNEAVPYYIPVRHAYIGDDGKYQYRSGPLQNHSIPKVYDWLKKITSIAKKWTNHNIKYDTHVFFNELRVMPKCKLECSIVLSKLASFQERFEYGLTSMMLLCGINITPYEDKIKSFLGKTLKDYGLIPPDQMATYAAVDTLAVRHLVRILRNKISAGCCRVEQLEMNLLPMLIQMEQIGCKVDIAKMGHDWTRLIELQKNRITRVKKHSGMPHFQIAKKNSLHELFVENLGWQLDYTDTSIKKIKKGEMKENNATHSYSYDSIRKHMAKNPRLVASFLSHQEDQKLLTSYIIPILEGHISSEGLIHCNINQQVRTGRMSVTAPAMQTLPPKAKYYIIPYNEEYSLVEFDLSQIEFRIIVHYINNARCIADYKNNPETDFHTWVANMCGIKRRPAKTVNFRLGYGGGKKGLLDSMMAMPDVFGASVSIEAIKSKANSIFNTYHSVLPELKPTSIRAGEVIKSRGYVRTLFGRERHIDPDYFYRAFNSVCQGTGADIQKDITLRLAKFISVDCLLHMLVHDSWLFSIKKDRLNELVPEIKHEIERPLEGVDFSVPILSAFGSSEKSWKQCS